LLSGFNMKKKIHPKLALNHQTVRLLHAAQLPSAVGGALDLQETVSNNPTAPCIPSSAP
jgi:hypothetical protein